MEQQIRYVVQDLDTFEFLCSDNGDVGQTPYISRAGLFETREDALTAAIDEIGEAFNIFSFALIQEASTSD